MALLNDPECGEAVTVTLPDPPDGIVTADGFVPSETVAALPVQVEVNFTAPDIWFVMLGLPTACT